jgi:hypothetical protein
VDGASCEGAGYKNEECEGRGAKGAGLIPFFFPDPKDKFVGAGYVLEHESIIDSPDASSSCNIRWAIAEQQSVSSYQATRAHGHLPN